MTTSPSDGIILFYDGAIPSVNKWLNAGMRKTYKGGSVRNYPTIYTSKTYAKAKADMVTSFRYQAKYIYYDSLVDITYYYRTTKRSDTDNFQKCVQDAIQDAGIIANDNLIRNIVVLRYYDKNPALMIHLFPAKKPNPMWPTGDNYVSL